MSHLTVDQGPGSDPQYDTKYQKSLRHYLTREALPTEANYRDLSSIHQDPGRPTLDDLHDSTYKPPEKPDGAFEDVEAPEKKKGKVIKFGWIQGVLMRCMLNIWGVMLFLRVSWMVGQAGLIEALVIVCFGNLVTSITAISMSAVATNGLISGGGVYYMISRSLGPEFGGSIGLMFTIANSIAVSTYIIGFVESLQDMLFDYFDTTMIDGGVNDIRAVGTIVLIGLMALAIVGMDWVTRVQIGLLFLLIGSQFDVVIGCLLGPLDDESMARGFVGWNGDVFSDNAFRDYRLYEGADQNIISVFAVFFTAVTGIVAGANLSGDLKDPRTSIPKGTLLAIAITFCTYIMYPFLLAANVVRDASGDVEAFRAFYYLNDSDTPDPDKNILDAPVFTICSTTGKEYVDDDNVTHPLCEFGLENSSQVMELVSGWGPLIYLGCFAATLSSAIASLVGAPRVLQALAKDRLYPGIFMFSKGFGANNDPVRGYCLVFVLSFLCVMIGDLNAVSTLLSNFFLASYSLINFSCFHASFIKSPGWRPSFKYYNMWVSLFGGVLCLVVMFLIDWITALVTFLVTIALYLFVSYRKPDVNWGSSTQAATYVTALKTILTLQTVEDHVKNYRPQILVMSGKPSSRPPLMDFASVLTKNLGLMLCGEVSKSIELKQRMQYINKCNDWLIKKKYKAFYNLIEAQDLEAGTVNLCQLAGLGKLKPNLVLMGYKSDWSSCEASELLAYFNSLHAAFDMQLSLCILRLPNGLDYSNIIEDEDSPKNPQESDGIEASGEAAKTKSKKRKFSLSTAFSGPGGTKLDPEIVSSITTFRRKQPEGTIDVWWLYDDGGLTLLLPYLLTMRPNWSSCKLRIFALANRRDELDMEQRSMATLLSKFRIDYGDVIVIPDAMSKASDENRKEFDGLIEKFKTSESGSSDGVSITEEELANQKDKINRHIRLRELLLENSTSANLIIMTLPMPRKGHVSATLYMAWLDYMSKNMPPMVFVRGNQQSVLTFYM